MTTAECRVGGAPEVAGSVSERDPGRAELPGRFRGIVFDMDGLLVDSEPSWAAAEAELFARHGRPFGPGDVLDTHGRSVEETLAIYAERLGQPPDLLFAEMIASVRRRYETEVPIRPGAAELLAHLDGRLPMAVASNSPVELVDLGLAAAWPPGAIDTIVTADDVARAKPAPDVYLEACARLGVPVDDVMALEDSCRASRRRRPPVWSRRACPSGSASTLRARAPTSSWRRWPTSCRTAA